MKKIRGDKPSGVIIHMYMEMSEGNSLSCFSFYLFSFFSYKIGEQEGQTSPA
jgi:hypothetical protein